MFAHLRLSNIQWKTITDNGLYQLEEIRIWSVSICIEAIESRRSHYGNENALTTESDIVIFIVIICWMKKKSKKRIIKPVRLAVYRNRLENCRDFDDEAILRMFMYDKFDW